MDSMAPAGCEIARLPDDLLSATFARTGPRDACHAAAVSPAFRAAVDADIVWSSFLPRDLPALADEELPADPLPKKQLFMRLSDPGSPVLLADGLTSMWLDRATGAKCYMLSARKLVIACMGETPRYWRWIPITVSRFSEAAELRHMSGGWKYVAISISRCSPNLQHIVLTLCSEELMGAAGLISHAWKRLSASKVAAAGRRAALVSTMATTAQIILGRRFTATLVKTHSFLEKEVMAGWRWRWVSSTAVKATMVRFPSALRRRKSRRVALLSWALRLDPRSNKWFDENLVRLNNGLRNQHC